MKALEEKLSSDRLNDKQELSKEISELTTKLTDLRKVLRKRSVLLLNLLKRNRTFLLVTSRNLL